jgi:hypothetical protein
LKEIEGSIYLGHDDKVYVINPVPTIWFENDENVEYIVSDTNIIRRAGTLKEAEDELLVLIELGGKP